MYCASLLSQGASMTQTACTISKLSLEFPSKTLFKNLKFNLNQQLSACIGRNGLGKSCILKILHAQNLKDLPYEGEISWNVPHAYLSQFSRLEADTIASALGVEDLYSAFQRIEIGNASFEDFELTENQWHRPALWQQQLKQTSLPTDLNFPVAQLSEGQKTKLALCALFLKTDHYLLLDEPSNHLDAFSRFWLIDRLKNHPAGAFVVSHDRGLLQHVEHIYTLNEFGLSHVTGNYEDYVQQNDLQNKALQRNALQQQRELKQLKLQQHETQMKAQKREQQGRVLRKSSTQAKVLLDFKKEQAGQSLASVQTQQQKQLEEKRSQLIQSQQQLEHVKEQQFVFQHHAEKTGEILRVKHFHRKTSQHQPFDLALQAGEKIHLKGKNGIGKSTFLKYLSQTTSQSSHETFLSVHTLYLDQNLSNLSPELSVLDNLAKFNPEVSSMEWRNQLGKLRIRGQKAELPFHCLSGGERLKVTLLGLNYLTPNIELLLLDEPENHLDIESRMLLAQAIQHYTGAVILVSHDAYFVESCGIQNSVQLVE